MWRALDAGLEDGPFVLKVNVFQLFFCLEFVYLPISVPLTSIITCSISQTEARILGRRWGTSFSQLLITVVDSGKSLKVLTEELTYESNLSGRLGCQWYACVI